MALALLACTSPAAPTFPAGLDPLEADTAPAPAAQGSDRTPEALETSVGDGDGFAYAHATGFIHAPLARVFDAFRSPPTVVDRRHVDRFDLTRDVEAGYDVSFRLHNTVHDIVTVEFDTTWREGVVQGSASAPDVVAGRAAKTAGTAYIDLLEDSVVLTRVDPAVTRVELVRHIKSATAGSPEAEQYLRDLWGSLRAAGHGEPLPTYR